jgi:ABC-type transport system substrate-binding protein
MQKRALEQAYTEAKAAFTEQRYFNTEFIGAGPYRVKEWARGSYIVLEANGDYALGRPTGSPGSLKMMGVGPWIPWRRTIA